MPTFYDMTHLLSSAGIEPGSPEISYLFHKISGTQASVGGSGARMPKGGQLSDAEIQTLRDWIAQGALDN
jgi:hypothetical protein